MAVVVLGVPMPDTDEDGDQVAAMVQAAGGWRIVPDHDRERRIYAREMGRRAAQKLNNEILATLADYARRLTWR